MKRVVLAVVLLALAAIGAKLYAKQAEQQAEAVRQRAELQALRAPVSATLKDPDSALWRNERRLAPNEGVRVCGEFNAKNSMGGYVGYRRFISNARRYMIEGESVDTWPLQEVLAMVPDDVRDASGYLARTESIDDSLKALMREEVFSWYWKTLCA